MKKVTSKEEAFELIELATDDIELLARAFDVVKEACEMDEDVRVALDKETPDYLIN